MLTAAEPGGNRQLVDPDRGASGRVELHLDRPGTRDVDLALEIDDLRAGRWNDLAERQQAGDRGIGHGPAAQVGLRSTWSRNASPPGTEFDRSAEIDLSTFQR